MAFFPRLLLQIVFAATITAAEKPPKSPMADIQIQLIALESAWAKPDHDPVYFQRAASLLTDLISKPEIDDRYWDLVLDIASGVLLKSRGGLEYGENAIPVRNNQTDVAERLISSAFMKQRAQLPRWREHRARHARLLVGLRFGWVALRDATVDGQMIVLDSTATLPGVERSAIARLEQNMRVSLQLDVKRFLAEVAPSIDAFLVSLYRDPGDAREFNELLAMGGYTPGERAHLVAKAASESLPDVLKAQLPKD